MYACNASVKSRAMQVDLFDFDLPNESIALRPAVPRDSARMLRVQPNERPSPLSDHRVSDLPDLLRAGDVLVFNDTRVIPGRLFGKRGDAKMQVTLHKRENTNRWWVFAKPAKKATVGDILDFSGLKAEVVALGDAGERLIEFELDGTDMTSALQAYGEMPLPPYIASQRPADAQDASDYQTVYAERDGAVAAPTAGLHFTPELLAALEAKGIRRETVTLHVGAGTFLPVKADDTDDHKMHSEWGEITADVAQRLNAYRSKGGRLVSVGTTSLRLLESAVDEDGIIQPFVGDTDIFITPGYRFKAIDALMTNFHLPRSTLFMLVSAFSGLEVMRQAYEHAVKSGYRFYSYGDSSLLFPAGGDE